MISEGGGDSELLKRREFAETMVRDAAVDYVQEAMQDRVFSRNVLYAFLRNSEKRRPSL